MTNTFEVENSESFTVSFNPISTDDTITGTIDWGDGSTDTYVTETITHTYADGGTYTVTYNTTDFTTMLGGFCNQNTYLITAVLDDGITTVSAGAFANTSNLQSVRIPYGAIVENQSFVNSGVTDVIFGAYKKPCTNVLSSHGSTSFYYCLKLENISYYTDDTSLQGTTVSDYFIVGSDEDGNPIYAPVKYVATYTVFVITDIPVSDYIIVYNMTETDFTHNGLRILSPSKCTITEELNGDYSLTLEHPCDNDGAWKSLIEFNIIKANGQLFRIYKKQTKLASSGVATRTVYAQHIFYDLGHKLIKSCSITNMAGQQALDTIINSIFDDDIDGAYRMYDFSRYSDITDVITAETTFNLVSPVACLLGEDNSVVNRLEGELHRDNFYFSICYGKEGSQSNAFNIVHGINMFEVEEVVDYSDFCTYLHTEDNYGNQYAVAYTPSLSYPHNFALGKSFSYNENNIDALGIDMHTYFKEHWTPKITYTVRFANIRKSEMYKDFSNLANYNVGDSGTIYSEELGINTTQTIIAKTVDCITGETTSITLGNFKSSLTRPSRLSNTISRVDNIIDRKISPYTVENVTQSEFDALTTLKDQQIYYIYE